MRESHQPPDAGHAPPNLGAGTFAFRSWSQITKSMPEHTSEVIDPQTHDKSNPVQNIVVLFEVLE